MIIYTITNIKTNKVYVGQTRRPKRRWYEHLNNLNKYVSLIDRAIQKYGVEYFKYEEIDTATSVDELNSKESKWIESLNTIYPNGYNLVAKGTTYIASEHTRKKQSDAQKKRMAENPVSKITRDKISKVHKGVKKSPEQIQKMKLNHRSRTHPNIKISSTPEPVGVRYRVDKKKYTEQYIAFITINGKSKSRSFAVKKYGKEKALQLAIEARKSFEQEAIRGYQLGSTDSGVLVTQVADRNYIE